MSGEKAFNADVFVEGRPMNTLTFSDEAPVCSLVSRAVREPRIPRERYGDRPAVDQLNDKRVFCQGNTLGPDFGDVNQ